MNLYQKLIEIRKEITYAKKETKGYNFQYASEDQILGAIRPKMDELGVFLEMGIIALDITECSAPEGKGPLKLKGVKATVKFTWVDADNPSDKIEIIDMVHDDGTDVSTVLGLKTCALRYFLYKNFSVPTGKDDPDAFHNALAKKVKSTKDDYLTDDQIDKISSLADDKRIERICKTYNASSLDEIESRHFNYILGTLKPQERTA